ncbi:chaperonin [Salmonella enterica]
MDSKGGAPLKTAPTSRTRAKSIRAMPVEYFDLHEQLRMSRKTSLDFSTYIIEAVREKLERDSAEQAGEGK